MISLSNIKSPAGARKTSKRLGRGNGSGKGTFSGKGCKGQNSRSGGGVPDWFEGGQTPLFRRMPKLKGFSNARFKKEYNIINLRDVEVLAASGVTTINKAVLLEKGLLRKKGLGVKLLGNGDLTVKVNITVNISSASAKEAVEKVGGELHLA